MSLFVLGVNYEVASAEIREKFFFSDDKILDEKEIIKSYGVEEFIFLQTCNRNEIYLLTKDEESIEDIKKYYLKDLSDEEKSCIFIKKNLDFIEHIYMVSCGLNSAILGEGEILGQVKNALEFSIKNGTSGKILNKIFREAITFSKRIKNEYKISENQTSVGAIASNFALEKLEGSVRKNILIVGSGEVAKLIIKYLKDIEGICVYITNRTRKNAEKIVENYSYIKVIDYEKRYEILSDMDFIISATASKEPVFKYNLVNLSKYENIYFMDLAIPRDIESKINDINGVSLYTVDYIKEISEKNMINRKKIAKIVYGELSKEVEVIEKWIKHTELDFFIKNINKMTNVSAEEIKKEIENRFKPDDKEKEKISKVVESNIKKLFKNAIINLKNLDEDEIQNYSLMLSKLFNF